MVAPGVRREALHRVNVGYVNGYVKYACNGRDRIDSSPPNITRDYNNSIYHGYIKGGLIHRSDGTREDDIFSAEGVALLP